MIRQNHSSNIYFTMLDFYVFLFAMNKKSKPFNSKNSEWVLRERVTLEERFLNSYREDSRRNLKLLRTFIGVTSKELAESSRVSHSYIRAVENGHRNFSIGSALAIAFTTGVDLCSLLTGQILLEWGGGKPYTQATYKAWVERDRKPSPSQEKNSHSQLKNLCSHACNDLNAGPLADALLTAYLFALMGGVDDKTLYGDAKA